MNDAHDRARSPMQAQRRQDVVIGSPTVAPSVRALEAGRDTPLRRLLGDRPMLRHSLGRQDRAVARPLTGAIREQPQSELPNARPARARRQRTASWSA